MYACLDMLVFKRDSLTYNAEDIKEMIFEERNN